MSAYGFLVVTPFLRQNPSVHYLLPLKEGIDSLKYPRLSVLELMIKKSSDLSRSIINDMTLIQRGPALCSCEGNVALRSTELEQTDFLKESTQSIIIRYA